MNSGDLFALAQGCWGFPSVVCGLLYLSSRKTQRYKNHLTGSRRYIEDI